MYEEVRGVRQSGACPGESRTLSRKESEMRSLRLIIVLTLGLLPGALHAQESFVLSAEPGVTELAYCQFVHDERSCKMVHISEITVSSRGTLLGIDGGQYLVEWSGPGYYLDSGTVLQPLGETKSGLKGQRWLEIHPREGRTHTSSSWKDLDGDHLLSIADELVLDSGRELRVKDVRLHLRVSPVPGGKPSSRAERSPERQ